MSNGNFNSDDDLIMGGTAEASAYNIPASLLQTFPCLMAEGREALRQQLEFVTSAVLLHPAEHEPRIDNTQAIMDRSKLMNDLLTSLYQAAQNLASLEMVNLDEEYRKETKQVSDMLQETQRQIYNFRLLTNQQTAQQWNVLQAQNVPANNQASSAVSGVASSSSGRSEHPGYAQSVPLAQRLQPAQASQDIPGFQIAGNTPSQSGQSSISNQSRQRFYSSTNFESSKSGRERRRVEKVLRKANRIIKRGVKGKKKTRTCRHCDRCRESR